MKSNRHHYSQLAFGMTLIALVMTAAVPTFRSQAQSVLGIRLTPTISVTGAIGTWQQIQYSDDVSNPTNWTMLTNLVLTHSPTIFTDLSSNAPRRFYRSITLTNVLNTNMVWIPPGTFLMGSPSDEVGRNPTNENQTQVTLTQGFFISKFEVTQLDYVSVVGSYPTMFGGPIDNDAPICNVKVAVDPPSSATNYCALLTTRDLASFRIPAGWAYRLPTEAEWEYTCRAGTATAFHYGNALYNNTNQPGLAWFNGKFPYPPTGPSDPTGIAPFQEIKVGSYLPNAFGLYDMHGNVAELCQDTMPIAQQPPVAYPSGPLTNPIVNLGVFHIIRGGSWLSQGTQCRSAFRAVEPAISYGSTTIGFRVVLAPVAP